MGSRLCAKLGGGEGLPSMFHVEQKAKMPKAVSAPINQHGTQCQQLGIRVERPDELQSYASGKRQRDRGQSCERDGRGVAKDGGAGCGVVVAGTKLGDGRAGVEEIVEAVEERGGAGTEGFHV